MSPVSAPRPTRPPRPPDDPRRSTSTSSFGVGRREAHDASDFYRRFPPPQISGDDRVERQPVLDQIWCLDARRMDEGRPRIRDNSVALVVTSPPYFAGKQYELETDEEHIPASYVEYLEMLHGVFEACVAKLEPGGRIAVNVANLGRKPYRSLAADVVTILQDRLGLLLRGEIIWQKGKGATGSTAWGSFQSPANPVLRDLTERVIVASKGRFDRAVPRPRRLDAGLPAASSLTKDEFMDATTDVWDIPPESATRVGHPAPFPVELPQRLIELYTYVDDVVLDPFMGSGSTAVAALRSGRHYLGFDTDRQYVQAANDRLAAEQDGPDREPRPVVRLTGARRAADEPGDATAAVEAGEKATTVAGRLLEAAGFEEVSDRVGRLPHGIEISLKATDRSGRPWLIEVVGGFTLPRTGLRRAEAVWRTLGKLSVLGAGAEDGPEVLLLTPVLPPATSPAAGALESVKGRLLVDALELLDPYTPDRLRELAGRPAAGD